MLVLSTFLKTSSSKNFTCMHVSVHHSIGVSCSIRSAYVQQHFAKLFLRQSEVSPSPSDDCFWHPASYLACQK